MNVGDYVRTKWGYICKIVNINDFREPSMKYGVEASYLKDIMFIGDEDIIKSSPNLIDVLEIGDYVNGYIVKDILDNGPNGFVVQTAIDFLYEREIKSIVTKEQFEQMEYKIQ